jgi:hypothetical protein
MQTINNLLNEYLSIVNSNEENDVKKIKINTLINQITGDGNVNNSLNLENKKKIVGIKVIQNYTKPEVKEVPLQKQASPHTLTTHHFYSPADEF